MTNYNDFISEVWQDQQLHCKSKNCTHQKGQSDLTKWEEKVWKGICDKVLVADTISGIGTSEGFKDNHKTNFKNKYLMHLVFCQSLKKKYTGQLVRQP